MMPNGNRVIINVYVESTNLRSDQRTDPIKKIDPNLLPTQPRVSRSQGYDRRAQLLAYAQELRHANAHQLHSPFNNSKPKKPKKRRWKVAVENIRRLFCRFDGIKSRKWNYEAVCKEEDYNDGDVSCNQQRMKKSRKENIHGRRRHSHFCKKLRCLLKEISRAWKSKNCND